MTEKHDRVDCGVAEENILKHFPDLHQIKVLHVIQMMVKSFVVWQAILLHKQKTLSPATTRRTLKHAKL